MRKMLDRNQKGFTLIELLVVIAIIGILAAVAIPQFAAYRANAYCGRVESDVSNAMIAQEAYFVENDAYAGSLSALNFTTDANVTVDITSTAPLTITGVDGTGNCQEGSQTFTAAAGAPGTWGTAAP